jgi:hypothetical protein
MYTPPPEELSHTLGHLNDAFQANFVGQEVVRLSTGVLLLLLFMVLCDPGTTGVSAAVPVVLFGVSH